MTFQIQRVISGDHPSLPGHFPGAPIVPAVVILDEIASAFGEWQRDYHISAINTLKFLAPLKPDQLFVISFFANQQTVGAVDVSCRIENQVIVQGRLLVRRRPI